MKSEKSVLKKINEPRDPWFPWVMFAIAIILLAALYYQVKGL